VYNLLSSKIGLGSKMLGLDGRSGSHSPREKYNHGLGYHSSHLGTTKQSKRHCEEQEHHGPLSSSRASKWRQLTALVSYSLGLVGMNFAFLHEKNVITKEAYHPSKQTNTLATQDSRIQINFHLIINF
jgi:hypothetical protein